MRKSFFLIPSAILVLIGVYYSIKLDTNSSSDNKLLTPIASSEIVQQHINKKIERRKHGYAKPDKPNKYVEYLQTLVSGNGKEAYGTNHKVNALKSAVAHRASLKSAKVTLPWVQRGPGNVGGRTRCIIVDPDDATGKTWFAGAVSGGIWKTTDAGNSWQIISPDFPNLAIVSLYMAPSNNNVIYAGTGEGFYNIDAVRGNGIFKSTDKGDTWTQLESTQNKKGFHYVNSMVVSHSNEDILWAATNSGIVKSSDGGVNWYSAGAPVNQRYQRIIIHPDNDNILWATCNNKGIYKTENGGQKWFLVKDMSNEGRIEITVAKNDPDKLYAIDEDSKVYYSHDGGTEWARATESGTATKFLEGQGWYNSVMAVDPTDADKGFIGGIDLFRFEIGAEVSSAGKQAFRITNNMPSLLRFAYFGGGYANGGVSIRSEYNQTHNISIQFGTGNKQQCHQLKKKGTAGDWTGMLTEDLDKLQYGSYLNVPFKVMNTSTGEQLHASFVDANNNNKFDIYDDGYEFILIHNVAYNPTNQNTAIQSNNGNYKIMVGIYPQLADGATWNESSLPNGDIKIESYSLKDRILNSTRISNWYADKTGPDYSHADHHDITIIENQGSPFSIIVGNDGGIGYSSNGGATWTSKSNGYITSQYYGITRHPKQYKYFGGLQDNGSTLSGNDPNRMSHWEDVLGGDGFDVVWHSRNPQMIIGSYYYNQLRKSIDGGETWLNIGALMGDNGDGDIAPFVTRIASCIADPDLLFTGGASGLWKSTNFGDSWKNINMGAHWGFSGNSSPKIAISQANPDIVWAGIHMNTDPRYNRGKLHVSTDGGESFTALEPFMDMGPISNILTHPTQPETAYMLFSFAYFPKIFRTTDLGQTWEDITGFGLEGSDEGSNNGFPDVAVNTLAVMPFDTNEIWVGTEIGLFISTNNGNSWIYADNGIPAVSIWDMKIIGDEVILGTHGLGVWTVKMDGLNNDIKHPHISKAGIKPNGHYVLNATFESPLDSFELYNNNGRLLTHYDIAPRAAHDIVFGALEPSDILYINGYRNGKKYSSNTVNLSPNSIMAPQTSYVNDFSNEDYLNDFVGEGFSIYEGDFGNNAIHSPHSYPENTDLYYTLKYPIVISTDPELAFIKYYDIAYLETGESGAVYPSIDFYDYAVVEGSKDGLNWQALSAGYDFSYNPAWSADGKTYDSTPTAKDYIDHHINLYDTFTAQDTILVRFRLHSDHFTSGWGWVIDNIRIQGSISNVGDELQANFETRVYPNPTNNGRVAVRITNSYIGSFEVSIYTVSGQQLATYSYFKGAETYEQQVDLPNLGSGIYLLKIKINDREKTEKLWIR